MIEGLFTPEPQVNAPIANIAKCQVDGNKALLLVPAVAQLMHRILECHPPAMKALFNRHKKTGTLRCRFSANFLATNAYL